MCVFDYIPIFRPKHTFQHFSVSNHLFYVFDPSQIYLFLTFLSRIIFVPHAVDKVIIKEADEHSGIATVAFGGKHDFHERNDEYGDYDSDYDDNKFPLCWMCVCKDGWWARSSNLPAGLDDLLAQRKNTADLKCVSLGPDGQWFVSAKNGRAWWGGLFTSNYDIIAPYKNMVTFMEFGDDFSLFVRYEYNN